MYFILIFFRTDGADRQTDGRTWRLLDLLGPEGRVGENPWSTIVDWKRVAIPQKFTKKNDFFLKAQII